MTKLLFLPLALMLTLAVSCNSAQTATTEKAATQQRTQRGGERMSAEQLFAQMDANKDGKIEQAEAKGPLAENFAKIDTNKDGTLSLEEIKNGKPSGGRPGGRPGGGE